MGLTRGRRNDTRTNHRCRPLPSEHAQHARAYREAVAAAQASLADDGWLEAVLKRLVRDDTDGSCLTKSPPENRPRTILPSAPILHFHTRANPDYPDQHPVNTFLERSGGFIPGDSTEATTSHRTLFEHPALVPAFSPTASGSKRCIPTPIRWPVSPPTSSTRTGNLLQHFDTNEFAVTVLVDAADESGLLRICARNPALPRLRALKLSGPCSRAVARVFALWILNRAICTNVPRPSTPTSRSHEWHRIPDFITAIFAYTEQDGVISRVEENSTTLWPSIAGTSRGGAGTRTRDALLN